MKINNVTFTGEYLPKEAQESLQKIVNKMKLANKHPENAGVLDDFDYLTTLETTDLDGNKKTFVDKGLEANPAGKAYNKVSSITMDKVELIIDNKTGEIVSLEAPDGMLYPNLYKKVTSFLRLLNEQFGNPQIVEKKYVNPLRTLLHLIRN